MDVKRVIAENFENSAGFREFELKELKKVVDFENSEQFCVFLEF